MRLRACIGGVLLLSGACAALPATVRIEVDGRVIEIRQQGFSGALDGGWSLSRECGGEPSLDAREIDVERVRVIAQNEIELLTEDNRLVHLYRCR